MSFENFHSHSPMNTLEIQGEVHDIISKRPFLIYNLLQIPETSPGNYFLGICTLIQVTDSIWRSATTCYSLPTQQMAPFTDSRQLSHQRTKPLGSSGCS